MEAQYYNLTQIVDDDKAPSLLIFHEGDFRDFLRLISEVTGKSIIFSPNWPMFLDRSCHRIIFADSDAEASELEVVLLNEEKKEK